MNKLVIIGNGFDLAHGLKTSYKDFILWCLRKAYETRKTNQFFNNIDNTDDLIVISTIKGKREPLFSGGKLYDNVNSISDFLEYCKDRNLEIKYKSTFIEKIVNDSINRWVDIEREYFTELIDIQSAHTNESISSKKLIQLNESVNLIRKELEIYLSSKFVGIPKKIDEISHIVNHDIYSGHIKSDCLTVLLNFNYTDTINIYFGKELIGKNIEVVNIHGQLNKTDNPIIFGYGDESNKYFEQIEDLNNNEFTKHLKSFSYLTTSNYKRLFELLGRGDFEIYVLGHSLGLSDRLLFNHIFEHAHFKKVQLYYHEFVKDGIIFNDFFQKTQELSRHFKLDAKHKMRTKVVPFNESKPLTQYKPQN